MRTRDARAVYRALAATNGLLQTTIWTTAAVSFITRAHLGPLQLVLLGTVMEASIFLLEIPTGIVADVAGRRRSVVTGTLLMGAATTLTGAIPHFPAMLAAQALWGLGYTFTSGATEAWIAGEVGDRAVGPLLLRGAQDARVGAVAGIGLSVALASAGLGLPMIAGGAIQLALGAWLARAMPETGFRTAAGAAGAGWRHLSTVARDGLGAARRDRVLLAMFAIALLAGMSTEGVDRLRELHLLREIGLPGLGRLDPVAWFGIIEAGALALGVAVIEPARRRLDTGDRRAMSGLLLVLAAVEAAAMVAFGLATGFAVAVTALFAYSGARGLRDPLYGAWVVPMIEPRLRATVLSGLGQADAVGEILGGPAVGLVATAAGPGLAIAASAVPLAPVAALLLGIRGRARRRDEVGRPGAATVQYGRSTPT